VRGPGLKAGPWLRPDGEACYLECKLVAHHHTGPLGATTPQLLEFSPQSLGAVGGGPAQRVEVK